MMREICCVGHNQNLQTLQRKFLSLNCPLLLYFKRRQILPFDSAYFCVYVVKISGPEGIEKKTSIHLCTVWKNKYCKLENFF